MADSPDGFPFADVVATESDVTLAYERLAGALQPIVFNADCVLLGVLMGGLIPLARLASLLTGDYAMDYCQVARYRGGTRGGELEWLQPPRTNLVGKTVLVIDDIFDEGVTLEYVARQCEELGANRVVTTVLVCKRHDRVATDFRPDFCGLEVGDRYVFGCGMDYRHRWRHLPSIYALKDEA